MPLRFYSLLSFRNGSMNSFTGTGVTTVDLKKSTLQKTNSGFQISIFITSKYKLDSSIGSKLFSLEVHAIRTITY
jgi:hypothetical protein